MSKFAQAIKNRFGSATTFKIPKQGNRPPFTATLTQSGITVDCLRSYPLLPWEVFEAVEALLARSPSKSSKRGSAMKAKLGDKALPLDSVEGQIALCYGKMIGDSVFRRVSPVANILVWAGLCEHGRGVLRLSDDYTIPHA